MKNRYYHEVALKNSDPSVSPASDGASANVRSIFDYASAETFALLHVICTQTVHYVPSSLADLLHQQLAAFEQMLYKAGYPYRSILFCQYCLAVCVDNVLLNTNWGRSNHWQYHQLTAHIHYKPEVNDQLHQMLDYLAHNHADGQLLSFVYTCVSLMAQCPHQQPIQWSEYSYPLYQALRAQYPQTQSAWLVNDSITHRIRSKFWRFSWRFPWLRSAGVLVLTSMGYLTFVTVWQYEQLHYALNLLGVS